MPDKNCALSAKSEGSSQRGRLSSLPLAISTHIAAPSTHSDERSVSAEVRDKGLSVTDADLLALRKGRGLRADGWLHTAVLPPGLGNGNDRRDGTRSARTLPSRT
jgi:hypothetical protein